MGKEDDPMSPYPENSDQYTSFAAGALLNASSRNCVTLTGIKDHQPIRSVKIEASDTKEPQVSYKSLGSGIWLRTDTRTTP